MAGRAGGRQPGGTGGMPRHKPPSPCAASSQLSAAFQPDGVWRPSSDHRLSPSPSLPQPRRDLTYVCAFPPNLSPLKMKQRRKTRLQVCMDPPPPAQRVMATARGFSGPRRELPTCTAGRCAWWLEVPFRGFSPLPFCLSTRRQGGEGERNRFAFHLPSQCPSAY